MARPKEFDKDKALQTALFTFWEKGFEGTSISDLTNAMGLSRSSLYETFGDKYDLFCTALHHYLEMTGSRRAAIFDSAVSVKQGIAEYFQGIIHFIISDEHPYGCFYTNTATALGTMDDRVRTVIAEGLAKQEEDFYKLLKRGQANGEIASDKDVRSLARYFVNVIRGMTVIARIQRDRKMLKDIVNVSLKVLG